jgi:hypothetical protein
MTQAVNQLTATKVHKLKTPGMYADGAGLYLQVTGKAVKKPAPCGAGSPFC